MAMVLSADGPVGKLDEWRAMLAARLLAGIETYVLWDRARKERFCLVEPDGPEHFAVFKTTEPHDVILELLAPYKWMHINANETFRKPLVGRVYPTRELAWVRPQDKAERLNPVQQRLL